jgi:hypothetical protein
LYLHHTKTQPRNEILVARIAVWVQKNALQNLKLIKQPIGDPDYICTTISQWPLCISQQNCNSSEASQPAAGANFPNCVEAQKTNQRWVEIQTVVDCCKLSHTHNTGLMIVKNLPRILLQQNTKKKKTRRRRRRRRRIRNWVTLRIGCQQCRSCEIWEDFHCKKISLQERKQEEEEEEEEEEKGCCNKSLPLFNCQKSNS